MRKLTANAIGGKDVSPRQEPDALRVEREITVFPAQAQTYTKNDDTSDLDAGVGESVGFVERSECGAEQITQSRHWARSGQLCPPSEDLKDLEQSGKAFNSGEEEAGSIKLIGRADTLPTEGFYD